MYILMLLLSLSLNLKSSSFNHSTISDNQNGYLKTSSTPFSDTIKFLQEIVSNKEKYIGKELNNLLIDLTLKPRVFFYDVKDRDGLLSSSINLIFFKGDEIEKRIKAHTISGSLTIHWQTPMDRETISGHLRTHGKHWNKPAEDFFGKQIIKDIVLE